MSSNVSLITSARRLAQSAWRLMTSTIKRQKVVDKQKSTSKQKGLVSYTPSKQITGSSRRKSAHWKTSPSKTVQKVALRGHGGKKHIGKYSDYPIAWTVLL